MDGNFLLLLAMCGMHVLWLCGPLVPAVLIFKLFPNTTVGLSGPLSGLTVRATGAFAAYTCVFIMAFPFANRIQNTVGMLFTPVWTLKAKVIPTDANGNRISDSLLLQGLTVDFNPKLHQISPPLVQLAIPAPRNKWPHVIFQIPNHGGLAIDLSDMKEGVEIDEFNRIIVLKKEVEIRELLSTGIGLGGGNRDGNGEGYGNGQ